MKITTYELNADMKLVPVDVAANSVKNNLKPGAVLHWGGNRAWPAQDYAVIRSSVSSFDGQIMYDCIALDGYARQRVEGQFLKTESDPAVWHGQHFFLTDKTLDADEVLDLIERSKVKVLADEATKNQAVDAFAKKCAELRALNNGLAQASSDSCGHVLAAKNIKKELAQAWPAVKFSVRSKSYSGGNNISVSWTDGPTSAQVDAILNKYSGGSFDGSEDLYTSCRTPWTEVYGSSKYISGSRTTTEAMVRRALASKGFAGDDRIRIEVYGESAAVRADDRGIEHWANDAVQNYDATKEETK